MKQRWLQTCSLLYLRSCRASCPLALYNVVWTRMKQFVATCDPCPSTIFPCRETLDALQSWSSLKQQSDGTWLREIKKGKPCFPDSWLTTRHCHRSELEPFVSLLIAIVYCAGPYAPGSCIAEVFPGWCSVEMYESTAAAGHGIQVEVLPHRWLNNIQ